MLGLYLKFFLYWILVNVGIGIQMPPFKLMNCIFPAECPSGFISQNGMPPCQQCDFNTYWTNSTTCENCAVNTITHARGSQSVSDCKGKLFQTKKIL